MATRRKATSASSSSPSKRTRSTRRDATSASRENGRRTEPETINVAADTPTETKSSTEFDEDRFVGEPVPAEEAKDRWPHRYQMEEENQAASIRKGGSKKEEDDEDVIIQARCHYTHAIVDDNVHYDLLDDAYVKAEDGQDPYICRITEMFEAMDGTPYVTCQWYYRAKDTDIKENWEMIDKKRVFLSQVKNDNPLSCLIKKLTIVKVKLGDEKPQIDYDYYYDMMYFLPYSSFIKVQHEDDVNTEVPPNIKSSLLLLDMYAGCGGMSTGLSIGCKLSGSNLVTKWAVDLNEFACQSLKKNHPETEVRNEAAENFLALLKEWRRLCATFGLISDSEVKKYTKLLSVDEDGKHSDFLSEEDEEQKSDILTENEDNSVNDVKIENDSTVTKGSKVYEVEKILDILFGVPNKKAKSGLYLKVRWKGYGPAEDSWEPLDGLSNCATSIKAFVFKGFKSKLLPLQGDVDVLCGGPPCQGISGFNRFRNTKNPLDDPKNSQLIVFMDVVDYLKPRYVLMENVVDILKFKDGYLGGYALGRLIGMNYQARTGIMAAGCYGLPQFRMRVFLWGAHNSEKLPQYPLPTHDVVTRGGAPVKAEKNLVAYDEGHKVELKKLLLLGDAISDLPQVTNFDKHDEMPYSRDPETDFQKHIRSKKNALDGLQDILYDHRALPLSNDDYARVQQVPKRKGANFRDLPGVCVGDDNKVYFDPSMEQVMLPSGKPLVPSYAMSFEDGRSPKPFGRLWWDETVPTIVTRAQPHNQRILHPEQDRVLSIRENARLQGFPDYYRLCGDVKQRYIQIGNAVAVPVGTALGYALGLALQGTATSDPVLTLPDKFPHIETP